MPWRLIPDTRGAAFAGLCILGLANGSVSRVSHALAENGFAAALLNTFDISVIVWLAFAAVPAMLLRVPPHPLTGTDRMVFAAALVLVLIPINPASWLALTGVGLHLLRTADTRSAGWVLLAVAASVFWGHWLLALAGGPVLAADAALVALLLGAERDGNTVGFAESDSFIWIAPGCSSLTNISLALLCWVLVVEYLGVPRSWSGLLRCLAACLAVVAVNIGRIGLMLLLPDWFDVIHGPLGAAAAAWLGLVLVVAICLSALPPRRAASA